MLRAGKPTADAGSGDRLLTRKRLVRCWFVVAGLLACPLRQCAFSGGLVPNGLCSDGRLRAYSCATARDSHAIPSWPPIAMGIDHGKNLISMYLHPTRFSLSTLQNYNHSSEWPNKVLNFWLLKMRLRRCCCRCVGKCVLGKIGGSKNREFAELYSILHIKSGMELRNFFRHGQIVFFYHFMSKKSLPCNKDPAGVVIRL